jgi:hypothetical protein
VNTGVKDYGHRGWMLTKLILKYSILCLADIQLGGRD